MKILNVTFSDSIGGADRAAYRLHCALLNIGVDSQMLVKVKNSDDVTVSGPRSKLQKAWSQVRPFLDHLALRSYKSKLNGPFSAAGIPFSGLAQEINSIKPDIVHLHWLNAGMMRIEDLLNIEAPIVWSLHDDWVYTGGCHIKRECEKYKERCGSCPRLGSQKEKDLSRRVFLRKEAVFKKIKFLNIIGLSKWMAECARQSTLLQNKPILNLPNPIDTKVFSPVYQSTARELLNLPVKKKLVMFGAVRATSDQNKGYQELSKALSQLDRKDVELVVFGSSGSNAPESFGLKTHYLGYLYDDVSLRLAYSAADVIVVPSLQENLSNVIMESMACATPVVAFDVGGNSDLIDSGTNGYLARPFDSADLAKGIDRVLTGQKSKNLGKNARLSIEKKFAQDKVAEVYREMYSNILKYKSSKDQ